MSAAAAAASLLDMADELEYLEKAEKPCPKSKCTPCEAPCCRISCTCDSKQPVQSRLRQCVRCQLNHCPEHHMHECADCDVHFICEWCADEYDSERFEGPDGFVCDSCLEDRRSRPSSNAPAAEADADMSGS
jgi:hypothetical protein